MVKNLPVNAGDAVDVGLISLGREDPVEEGMATLSSVLAWRIPLTEEPGRLQPVGLHRVRLSTHTPKCGRRETFPTFFPSQRLLPLWSEGLHCPQVCMLKA